MCKLCSPLQWWPNIQTLWLKLGRASLQSQQFFEHMVPSMEWLWFLQVQNLVKLFSSQTRLQFNYQIIVYPSFNWKQFSDALKNTTCTRNCMELCLAIVRYITDVKGYYNYDVSCTLTRCHVVCCCSLCVAVCVVATFTDLHVHYVVLTPSYLLYRSPTNPGKKHQWHH